MSVLDLEQKLYTPKLRVEKEGELRVVIDPDNARWISVNDFGARMLAAANDRTFAELAREFSKDVKDKDRFESRLKKYLHKCAKRGFLTNTQPSGNVYRGRAGQIGIKRLHEMWILTNFTCNLRCKHCYTMDRVNKDRRILEADELKKIIDDARALGTEVFYFSGGEPFLRKDIMSLVEYVTERSTLILFTNGTLITEEIAKKLSNFKERLIIQVSIEGHDEENNSKIRNKGMFKRAMTGVKLLLEEGIMVGISSTPISSTKESVPKLTELLGKLKVNSNSVRYHHLIYMICFGNALKFPFMTLSSDELSEVYDSCCSVRKDLKKKKINRALKITNEKIFDAYATNGPKKDLCGAGYTILAVDTQGKLYPCASTISDPRYNAGSLVDEEGRYTPGRLKELWEESKVLEDIRGFTIKRHDDEPEDDLRFFHGGGCWYNMNDPKGAFSKEHFFAGTYEDKTLQAIMKAAGDDLDEDDITNKYPKMYNYMSPERIACAGSRKTVDKSDDGLDIGYCICFS